MSKGYPPSKQKHFTIVAGSTWSREQPIMLARLRVLGLSYAQYLETPRWSDLVKRLRADRCIACSGRRRLSLHHVTYVRLGYERDDDFVTLCGLCHEQIHEAAASGAFSLDPRDYSHLSCYRGPSSPSGRHGYQITKLPDAERSQQQQPFSNSRPPKRGGKRKKSRRRR